MVFFVSLDVTSHEDHHCFSNHLSETSRQEENLSSEDKFYIDPIWRIKIEQMETKRKRQFFDSPSCRSSYELVYQKSDKAPLKQHD